MNIPVAFTPETRCTYVRYTVLAWACSLSMLTYIDRVCIKEVGSDMQSALGISEQDFAWVFSAFGLAYALFEVPSGWLGDRFGPRQVLCRIVLWWSFFTALTGCIWKFSFDLGYILPLPYPLSIWFESIPLIFNSLMLLVIIRFLFGMGEAGAYPNTARALRNWFPYARRGLAQGLLWTFGRWGGAIAPSMVGVALFTIPYVWRGVFVFFGIGTDADGDNLALPDTYGWRGAFILFGIMGVTWAIFFAYFFRNTPADHPGVNAAERAYIQEKGDERAKLPISWGTMLRSPTLWCLSGMYFFSNSGWCFFITWDKKYYETVLGLRDWKLWLASSSPLFFGGMACLLGGFLTDRQVRVWGRRWGRTLQGFVSYFLGGCFFLLAFSVDIPFLAVASLCLASFFKDFAMAVSWSTCIDVGHRYSGTVAGFMNGVGNLGTFFAPPIVAHLARKGEWRLALVFSACMFFLSCSCWLFINPRKVIVYSDADRDRLKAEGVLL